MNEILWAKKLNSKFLALLSSLVLAAGCLNAQTTFLTNGLVLYFPCNGSANDASGNGNGGIVTGATLGTNRFGMSPNSYVFAATGSYPTWLGDYITTTNSNGFPVSTNDFTASLWMLTSSNSPDYQMLFCDQEVNQFQFALSIFSGSTATLQFYSGQDLLGPSCESSNLDWTLGQWYNVQVVRATNTISIYRNGSLVGQNVWTEGNEASPADLVLNFGYRTAPDNHPLIGQLDDMRVYNRALSASELQQLFIFESGVITGIQTAPVITIPGTNGEVFNLQYETNLNSGIWQTLISNIVLQSNSFQYIDTNAIGAPVRFYRTIPQ